MWTLIEGPKVLKVTPALIRRFAEMEPCPKDRPKKPPILAVVRKALEAGTFRTCEWASATCQETGREYRVNGKHTSSVMADMIGRLPDLFVVVSKFDCPTLQDLADLYATFDVRTSTRTTGDINRIYAASHPDLAALPAKVINTAVTGMAQNLWECSYATRPPEERALLMLEHTNFVLFAHAIWREPEKENSDHLVRGPVAAAMARTFFKCPKAANVFWRLVRDANTGDPRSPDRVLHKYLTTHSVSMGHGIKSRKSAAAAREIFVKCIHGWNAWRRGESTSLKYHPDAKTPAAL